MRTGSTSLLALLATVLALAGCGGDASATAGIEAVCARHNRALTALTVTPIETEAQLMSVQRRRASIEQATLRELAALKVTRAIQPTWEHLNVDRRALIDAVLAYSGHGLDKPSVGEAEAAAQKQAALLALARDAGLKECTRSG